MTRLLCTSWVSLLLVAGCSAKPTDPPATAPDGPGGAYDPCAGKSCGELCTLCSPDDADCNETAESKECDAAGTCSSAPAECSEEGGGPEAYDPCANKSCGDPCTVCPPNAADCMETMEVKACDASGACSSSPAECG